MNKALTVLLIFCGSIPPRAQAQINGPPSEIDILHYRFELTLSDESDRIRGQAEVVLRFLEEGPGAFSLDLIGPEAGSKTGMAVLAVSLEGVPIGFRQQGNRLNILTGTANEAGDEGTVQITYEGIPGDGLIIGVNEFGDRTFFGDNWPNRARHWLPTHDHPSDKATVEWVVTAPARYRVVGTGSLVERRAMGDRLARTHWKSSVPVSTKVMVMGAARFAIRETGTVGATPIEAWVYPQDSLAGFRDFARAEEAVRFFEERVGPFPYAKLANVQSKTRYGGMENASNIFYAERAVRGDGRNESLIVHEVAHQWFGDSVTESDWRHLWLSEGFATYFTHLFNEEHYGSERLREGMRRDRRTVVRFLRERPRLALVPAEAHDPNELLNDNSYQKGGWILHMLRRTLGDDVFWRGIRDYYTEFRDGTATTGDFQQVMERTSGEDLEWFFRQWAFQAGHPVLKVEWEHDPSSGTLDLQVRQVQDTGTLFRFPLDIGVSLPDGSEKAVGSVDVVPDAGPQRFSLPLQLSPRDVILDPDCWLLFEGEVAGGNRTAVTSSAAKGR